jgi:hypothetical protein
VAFGFSSGAFESVGPGLFIVHFDRGFNTAHFASGLEKLAFEVFFCLLTSQGSIPNDPDFGTLLRQFIGQMGLGADTNEASIFITNEVIKCENQVRGRQAARNLPLDERLKQIVLDEVAIDRSAQSATLRLFIVNELDQTVGFEIPSVGGAP